jgi:hypothetical protein
MSKVFIHVGLHKTASTFLQEQVFPLFPEMTYLGRPYTQQNKAFNKLQYADDSLYNAEEFLKEFEKNSGDKNIISDELLSGIPESNYLNRSIIANRLSTVFPEAEILLFIRGQKDILLSHYYQSVKIGTTYRPIDSYVWLPQKEYTYDMYREGNVQWDLRSRYFNHFTPNIHPDHFFYHELIGLYNEKFRKVHVFLYEDFCKNPVKNINRLEGIIGDKISAKKDDLFREKANLRLKSDGLKIRKFENRMRSITARKSVLNLFSSIYGMASKIFSYNEMSDAEYVANLINGYYIWNNQKVMNQYPSIPMAEYPEYYQF